jgi:hypothetical protein
MFRASLFFAIVAAGLSCTLTQRLFAQVGGIPSYGGESPRLSPWLNLYQRQAGPLDPYHMYVQPEVQLRNTLQVQQAGIQRNKAALNTVAEHVVSTEEAFNAPATPTGVAAGFMTQGMYFNSYSGGGGGYSGSSLGLGLPQKSSLRYANNGGATLGAPAPSVGSRGRTH